MASKDEVKIKSIYNTGESNAELVVKIKNDYINECSGFDVRVFADKNHASKTAVVASKGDSFYSGKCENSLCQNYLVIVNKNKKRARLLPINVCDLSEVKTKNDSASKSELDDFNKRKLLTEKFGSKKSKRKMELSNKMRVNPEACEANLKSILDETVIDESYFEDICDGTESLERLIPPCNRFASTAQDVYNLDDILNESERESLKEAAEYLIENPPVEDDSVNSKFIYSHYKIISKNLNVDKLIILLYADSLLRLLKMAKKDLKSRDAWNTISPHSKLILTKIRKEFTDSKILTTYMRHKVVCHALVAILLACSYKIHLDKISTFFPGIDTRKLHQLCSLVGAAPQARGMSDVLSLQVPMPPLPIAKSPKKKRR